MLRIVFAGTPEFAASALAAIAGAGHEIALVLTRVDRPGGRGQALRESPVKRLARERGLPVEQPRTLRDPELQRRLRDVGADVMVVAAYGAILPPEVLAIPRLGCLNIHASLLPRWRGAAPIQRAIEAGDRETGITIMQMDEGLDTGAMLLVEREPIRADDTGGSVHDRLAALGARTIVAALAALERGELRAHAQPAEGVTYAAKLTRADESIDWSLPALALVDRVRAFDPVPGSVTALAAEPRQRIRIWRVRAATGAQAPAAEPGTVLESGARLVVACGDGAVEVLELQKPGGRRLAAADFLRGFPVPARARFVPFEPTPATP